MSDSNSVDMPTLEELKCGFHSLPHPDAYKAVLESLDKCGNSKDFHLAVLKNVVAVLEDDIKSEYEMLADLSSEEA